VIIKQDFDININYKVLFTTNCICIDNAHIFNLFIFYIRYIKVKQVTPIIFILDHKVYLNFKNLFQDFDIFNILYKYIIHNYRYPFLIKGGEYVKNNIQLFNNIIGMMHINKLCRHSYMDLIGGGALLDTCGFISNIVHRGIRLIRVPTTILSQNDSGVGIKAGINFFKKKNFIGSFLIPNFVINDYKFLLSLDNRMWKSGISEAIKVSLIRDLNFFWYIKTNFKFLLCKNVIIIKNIIYHCSKLHMYHISVYNDPFEQGISRPLDFGHWLAHKLEQIADYKILHGEAVALGIITDCIYSYLINYLINLNYFDIINLFLDLKYVLYYPYLNKFNNKYFLINSLIEFREHLGGILTIMLINKIGVTSNTHIMEIPIIKLCINILRKIC